MIPLMDAARLLAKRFGARLPEAYVPGKTVLRDALCEDAKVSQAEAETLCDSLERSGILRFEQSSEEGAAWSLTLPPAMA